MSGRNFIVNSNKSFILCDLRRKNPESSEVKKIGHFESGKFFKFAESSRGRRSRLNFFEGVFLKLSK